MENGRLKIEQRGRERGKEPCIIIIIPRASRLQTGLSKSDFQKTQLRFFACLDSNSSFPQHLITPSSPLGKKEKVRALDMTHHESQANTQTPPGSRLDQSGRPGAPTAIVAPDVPPSLIVSNARRLCPNITRRAAKTLSRRWRAHQEHGAAGVFH